MPRRYQLHELSDSAAIVRLLELGITRTADILFVCAAFRSGNYGFLLDFFARRRCPWPAMFPVDCDPSPTHIRVVRSRWRRGQIGKPRRKAGQPPIRRRRKTGRKFISQSERIRRMLAARATTEQIKAKLGVTANLIRQVRHSFVSKRDTSCFSS
jgi:hypothetical protein